jgi:hypothetical protein
MQIGVANSSRHDPHPHLARLKAAQLDGFQPGHRHVIAGNGGCDLHDVTLQFIFFIRDKEVASPQLIYSATPYPVPFHSIYLTEEISVRCTPSPNATVVSPRLLGLEY